MGTESRNSNNNSNSNFTTTGGPLSNLTGTATKTITTNGTTATKNTDKWSTRQLVTMALFCSIAIVLSFIEIPIFPAAPFLKYDPSFVPVIICALAYGAGPGLAVGLVEILIHSIILADPFGGIMNVLVITTFVLCAGLIYKKNHTRNGAILGLLVGAVTAIIMAIAGNLVITPLYAGVGVDAVITMIVPILLPFNAIKHFLNAVLTMVIYKSISNLITPKKQQVKGK